MKQPAIELRDVDFSYTGLRQLFTARPSHQALNRVSLIARTGQCVGVIGESGSGKSSLARIVTGINQPDQGEVWIQGQKIQDRSRSTQLRKRVQMVFQNPNASLDPGWPVWKCIAEGLLIHGMAKTEARNRVISLMRAISLDSNLADHRPHELSGGQRQRVAIGRALALDPTIIVLDEPTSALDLSVQAGVLNLLLSLQQKRELTYLLITHDIDVVRHMAHYIYVMQASHVVEHGPVEQVLTTPKTDYTKRLIEASPVIAGDAT